MGSRASIIITFVLLAGCANERQAYRSQPGTASSTPVIYNQNPRATLEVAPATQQGQLPKAQQQQPVETPAQQPVTPQQVPQIEEQPPQVQQQQPPQLQQEQPATPEQPPIAEQPQEQPPQVPPQLPQEAPAAPQVQQPAAPAVHATDAQAVLNIVNQERAKNGLGPLVLDSRLSAVAQAYAQDMQTRNYFSREHLTPEGKDLRGRLQDGAARFSAAAENIAFGQQSPQEVMQTWIDSPGHKSNIMNPQFGKLGVGRAGIYWVQVFTN
jgi:uncharacterized protein YkwD